MRKNKPLTRVFFPDNSAKTLTWFKVTTNPLTKGTIWVKYKLDWAKGGIRYASDKISRTDIWTEERTNRQISLGRPQSWTLTKWTYHTTDENWTYDVYQKQFWYIWKTKMHELTKCISTEILDKRLCIRINIKVYF